jgi:hypothetical protein
MLRLPVLLALQNVVNGLVTSAADFAYEKLELMPVEDAGEREEKQRDEPSQLSPLWGDSGITESETASRVRSKCGKLEAERTGRLGPCGSVPTPPGRRSPTQRAHPTLTSIADGSS